MKKPNTYSLDLQLFAEEVKDGESNPPVVEQKVDPNAPTVKALKELKNKTVSKEKYEALEKNYQEALDAIINGNGVQPSTEKTEDKVDVEELRKDLFDGKKRL